MELNAETMDRLVFEIVRDTAGKGLEYPLDREEISQFVLEHITANLSNYVLLAINRLVGSGAIIEDRDVGDIHHHGRPYRYWLPSGRGA